MTNQFSFEKAYERLEEILNILNDGEVSLDRSLTLYEEASKLIKECNTKLTSAEKKIEVLMKNNDGTLALDENGIPQATPFSTGDETLISREVE